MEKESISFLEDDIPDVVKVIRKGLENSIVPERIRAILTGRCYSLEKSWAGKQGSQANTPSVESIMKQCARLVCSHCNDQRTWDEAHLEDGYWTHRPREQKYKENSRSCKAEEIWEKISKS